MVDRAIRAVNAFPEKFGEAFLACMFAMSNGDVSVWTFKHVKVAYNTGIGTAVTFAICVLLFKKITPFSTVLLTVGLTTFADLLNHPTHYGSWWSEAAITGLIAGCFSLFFQLFWVRMKRN